VATGSLVVTAQRAADRLTVTVADNGAGLPADFDLDKATSLGLQIVRTLVIAELGGQLAIGPQAGGGTLVRVELPIAALALRKNPPEQDAAVHAEMADMK
jgi:two-component sensor histidine kinase